jgi:hypothetical protein
MANQLKASHQIHTTSHPRTTKLKRNQRKLNIYQSIVAKPLSLRFSLELQWDRQNLMTQATTLQPSVELS